MMRESGNDRNEYNREPKRGKKLCFVAAIELSIRVFMVEHLKKLCRENSITVVVNTDNKDFLTPYELDVKVFPVKIKRKPSPFSDVVAFFRLYKFFRREGFDAVHSITPKAGLISMLASCFAGIPVRVHTFTGQVWATAEGVKRGALKGMDRLLALCATHILADSKSQQDFIIKEGIFKSGKSFVVGNGSICGVDTMRFKPDPEMRKEVRDALSIPEEDVVFLFLGRLTVDKGILDLAVAFSHLSLLNKNAHLLIVGPDEDGMKDRVIASCTNCLEKIHFHDFTDKPEIFMTASDVLCLPSYREGFGIVIIEAGSTGIPSIGTRIYGITDSIEEDVTGYLYEPKNTEELTEKMLKMVQSGHVRIDMGGKARDRAIRFFSKEYVTDAFLHFYNSLPDTKNIHEKAI